MDLGRYGLWHGRWGLDGSLAATIEQAGFHTLWIGGSPPAELTVVDEVLAATEHLVVATSIVNMWDSPAPAVAESYHRIVDRFPRRFLLGVGIGHPEAVQGYRSPFETIVAYLDQLDAAGVPKEGRLLAALGPKVLRVAGERTAGAIPYLTTPDHTAAAREILGPGPLLAPEQKVVLGDDREQTHAIGRAAVRDPYLSLTNYVRNLRRFGFTEEDIADGGSDRLIDALVAQGDARTVVGQLSRHFEAGADHVGVQLLTAKGADRAAAIGQLGGILFS